ncbi:hypothetical protein [Actinacidiphila bryophytorum]|uniref:hypothetical protein n=1 Tax=Actinacidiphila bryophytorum TaxID=1436133 RepID=UPI002176B08A|nr:hypothetical protein [Actinacidiphila bryophytorum]UWE11772.1 hypothetical protein NYE86_25770 [Actinacidiphila bryophytorum]
MPGTNAPEAVVASLFQEFRSEKWPPRLNIAERAGVDLVMLDADIAGCVTTWLSNGGSLDARRLEILRRKLSDLEQVLPELDEADNPRLWRLWHEMARLILDADPRPAI